MTQAEPVVPRETPTPPESTDPAGLLAARLAQGPLAVGRTAEIYAWGDGQVLKLFRQGVPAGMAEKEAHNGRIVAEAGVGAPPVGEVLAVGERQGIVCSRIDGESMLVHLQRRPWTYGRHARTLGQLHARMHTVSRPELPSMRSYLRRAIERTPALPHSLRATVLARLDSMPDGAAICHGDFHPDNVLLTAQGPVIIDWMTACAGNPAADVARTVLMLRQGEPPGASRLQLRLIAILRDALLRGYLRAYRAQRPLPDRAIVAWTPIIAAARLDEGIAAEREQLLALAAGARLD